MSARYLGGIVSRDPLTLNPAAGNAANGVFTLNQYMQAVKNATWPGFDPYFNETVLLLHGNGTNGAQNNTFLDSSTNNFTITRNGNTTQGTFSPFSLAAGEWSNYFDGSGDYLDTPSNAALAFGTGDFTIEFWAYITSHKNFIELLDARGGTAASVALPVLYTDSAGLLYYFVNNANRITSGAALPTNSWVHIAVSRSGVSTRLFVNGTQSGSTYSDSINYTQAVWRIGSANNGTAADTTNYSLPGYLSNFRVIKGTAVYTSAFTPPTTPLTNITNTSLLTCQSNRFVDNSTANSGTGFTITRNGDVRVTPFSPFAPTAAYSAGTNGGSGYFDGTTDYLSLTNASALQLTNSTAFTIELWVYFLGVANSPHLIRAYNPSSPFQGYGIRVWTSGSGNTGFLEFWDGTAWNSFGVPPVVGAWNHIAVSYEGSGTTRRFFLNGAQVGSAGTVPSTINYTSGTIDIGSAGASADTNGYISGLRILKGTGYSSISIPTSPPTAITNTQLLLNFTNAGIIDNTGKNVLETVGNAQIDTAVKKFGDGSMEFDGTGDYLATRSNPEINLSSGNFTIEAWVYWTGSNANSTIVDKDSVSGSTYMSYNMSLNGSGYVICYVGSGNGVSSIQSITSNTLLPTNQWVHLAFVKNGTTLTLYQNGSSVASATQTATIIDGNKPLLVGYLSGAASGYYFNGYIDDLRITKGVARYTANFTPQTSQWQDQ